MDTAARAKIFFVELFVFLLVGKDQHCLLTFMLKDYTIIPYTELSLGAFLPLDGWLVKGIPLDICKHV